MPFVSQRPKQIVAASGTAGQVLAVKSATELEYVNVAAAHIANDAVTYAKIQNVTATDKVLGRSTAGAGDVEEIACTAAGRALIDDADASAQRTTLGLGTLATQSGTFSGTSSGTNTGDQTSVSGNAGTATALQTARAINGVDFDGTAPITVTAAGSTLSGTSIAAGMLGTAGTTACAGNDARLSDARTPTAHAASHKSGGSDPIKLDELAAPTDVTTLNASTTAHGLLPKLPGGTTTFLRADGTFAAAGGAGTPATAVVSETAFGQAAAVGVGTDYARNDHTHGTPASVATANIDDDAVTYAKIQNVTATDKVLGRSTAGAGDVEEIACTAFARSILDDVDAAAVRATIGAGTGNGTVTNVTGTAPISSSGGATPAISLDNAGVTYAKIQNISATDKLLGRSTAGAGVTEEIACTAAGRALIDDADAAAQRTTLGLGTAAVEAATAFAAATHATTHKSGGADAIKLDELAATTDVTTLNASTTAHGLLPKLSNVATEYLNGQGAFTVPAGGSGGALTKAAAATVAAGADTTWLVLAANSSDITGVTLTKVMEVTGVGVGRWHYRCCLVYQATATSTGMGVAVNHTGTTTQFLAQKTIATTGGAAATNAATSVGATAGGNLSETQSTRTKNAMIGAVSISVDAINSDMMVIIEGFFVVSVTGSLEILLRAELAALVVRAMQGSFLELKKLS